MNIRWLNGFLFKVLYTVKIDCGSDGIETFTELRIKIARELGFLLRGTYPVNGIATADVISIAWIVVIVFAFNLLHLFDDTEGVLLQVGVIGNVVDLFEGHQWFVFN